MESKFQTKWNLKDELGYMRMPREYQNTMIQLWDLFKREGCQVEWIAYQLIVNESYDT